MKRIMIVLMISMAVILSGCTETRESLKGIADTVNTIAEKAEEQKRFTTKYVQTTGNTEIRVLLDQDSGLCYLLISSRDENSSGDGNIIFIPYMKNSSTQYSSNDFNS